MINGFTISKTKTQCVHFCQLRKMHNNPTLKQDGSEIPVVDKYKFLSIIFDKKLSFIPHIQYLKDKCNKTLKLLHIIAHKEWGVDQHTFLKLYRTLIHSKIDYGCFIYGAARQTYFKPLNTVNHEKDWDSPWGLLEHPQWRAFILKLYEPPLKLRIYKIRTTILL